MLDIRFWLERRRADARLAYVQTDAQAFFGVVF